MDSDILETLYEKYYGTAIIYTLSLCKNKDTAEDIVSDAFIKAYLTLTDGRRDFKYWLLVVCRNLWIDYLRKNRRISDVPVEESMACEYVDLTEKLIRDECYRYLYDGIMKLSDHYRDVLILYYFSEIPIAQIAVMLGKRSENIKSTLFRARKKLKSIMEVNGYEF